jgi:putative flippase GtrA
LARIVPLFEISRFAVVGCANTLIDFGMFWMLAGAAKLPLIAANLGAWAVAFTFSLLVNGRWTFGLSWARILRPDYYGRLAVANLFSVMCTTSVLLICAGHTDLAIAKILSIGVGFLLNYSIAKLASAR